MDFTGARFEVWCRSNKKVSDIKIVAKRSISIIEEIDEENFDVSVVLEITSEVKELLTEQKILEEMSKKLEKEISQTELEIYDFFDV